MRAKYIYILLYSIIMEYSINAEDKSRFKCFKFADGSVYYGEISYIDQKNTIVALAHKRIDHESAAVQPR